MTIQNVPMTRTRTTPPGVRRSPLALDPLGAMDAMFDSFFGARAPVATSAPPLNLWDTGGSWVIEMELPGFTMEQLDISLLGDQLTLSGKREVSAPESATILRSERRSQEFTRSITLPGDVDQEGVTASLRNGVLTIELPKSPAAQPRKIPVANG